ncbi:TonB-dependent receptor family protein [Bacterioplanoides sp.]|uniref:TonB-dependent receptor family protein n=1 Tax=Bacterioplanoides sp. TaxID=2066072 RepID=UPI003AFFD167
MSKLFLNFPFTTSPLFANPGRYAAKPLALAVALAAAPVALAVDASDDEAVLDNVYITGGADEIRRQPGSATLIDDVALDTFEYTDIHRVLNAVPGVNLQEEDGYGLRPNIGLRGTAPERSKKVTVMEDGVLSGPAPYSAPAAYYFPNVSRMSAVEVFKGPSTIQYGPATIGGAINLVSRPIPYNNEGEVDAQYGSHDFRRLSAFYGGQQGNVGYLIEGLHVATDGFKDLDGGGDTGFERNDINFKTSYQLLGEESSQLFQLKLGYADEESDETYLGLTKDDFDDDPYRRYASSQLDNMNWEHTQVQLTHQFEMNDFTLTTDVYRNGFERDWFKLNSFNTNDVTLSEILANPDDPQNRSFYQILTGERASGLSEAEELRIGNNGRKFVSQGIQTRANYSINTAEISHELEVGLRIHQDEIRRHHTEQSYRMLPGGILQAVDGTFESTTRNKDEATAIAVYIKDDIQIDNTTITIGVRHEEIETTRTVYDLVNGSRVSKTELDQSITLPGIGVYSQLTDTFGVLGGVHKGFTAATPSSDDDIQPEESINYELGGRYSGYGQAEVIAFLNDYNQFSGTCSFQNGCDNDLVDDQANAGNAQVYGVEASWGHEYQLSHLSLPVSTSYTYSRGEFGEDFTDTTGAFGEAGLDIEEGYRIAYLPEHRLNVQTGLTNGVWAVHLSALYQSEVRNVPGKGSIAEEDKVDAYTVFDLSGSYQVTKQLQLYSTVDNVFANEYVVAVKPYGFRPGKDRSVNVGAKFKF